MPWCEPCERYLTPNTVAVDGSCPTCGNEVDVAPDPGPGSPAAGITDRVPWHFWLIVLLAGVYLGWRAVQGLALLF